MKTSAKNVKPYWEMNKDELAEATKEFDEEIQPNTFHPLGPQKQAIWERLQGPRSTGAQRGANNVKGWTVRSQGDLQRMRTMIKKATTGCLKRLRKITELGPMEVLGHFKFDRVGHNPLDPSQEMNLVEQINQSATLLVACAALERLLKKHPSATGYVISPPTAKGYDISAIDVSVAAEIFAATAPGSNRKLRKDLEAVLKNKEPFQFDPPQHRYVFFACRSLKGFPSKHLVKAPDTVLGDEVWHLVSHGRSSVSVVRLPEDAVFEARKG